MPQAQVKVAYVNQKEKGPSNIKGEDGRYYKVWTSGKAPIDLAQFKVGDSYDIEFEEGEYNGKPTYTVRKVLSASTSTNGGGNGVHGSAPAESAADRSASIQRQHSQEMALRLAEIMAAFTKKVPTFEDVQRLTDQFQLDIANIPQAYDPVADAKGLFKAVEKPF